MGRKLKPDEQMYELEEWDAEDGDFDSSDIEESIVVKHEQRNARQQLEDYFEMKALRQRLGEDPLDELLSL